MDSRDKYDTNVDEVYKKFLDHLREDGSSYILEMIDEHDGSKVLLKYEEKNELPDPRSTSKKMRGEQRTKASHANGVSSAIPVKTAPIMQSLSKTTSFVDLSYQKFLDHLRLENGFMVLEWKSGLSIKYEVKKTPSSNEMQTEKPVCSEGRYLVPYGISAEASNRQFKVFEDDSRAILMHGATDSFQYREKLKEALTKPYDQNEYEELLKKASERKPKIRFKHLRNDDISYPTNEPGQSYLDHHPGLARKLEDADRNRKLFLLRGFFFWLKNLCHEGSFVPWISSLDLELEKLLTSGDEITLPENLTAIEEVPVTMEDVSVKEEQSHGNLPVGSSYN